MRSHYSTSLSTDYIEYSLISVIVVLMIGCKCMKFDQNNRSCENWDRSPVLAETKVLQHVYTHSNVPILEAPLTLSLFW